MSDYQRKKSKYLLGRILYNKTIWRIRDYNRLREIADSLIETAPDPNQVKSKTNKISDSVGNIVIKRDEYIREVDIIDKCLLAIPEEYRKGVWNNIMYNQPYPVYADRSTYGRWKSKFVQDVAQKLEML